MERDNAGRSAIIAERKRREMQHRMEDLQKRYPGNRYKIVEKVDKKKGIVSSIVREREIGRRHHKISHKKD
jgi:hypothetical protein